jgi:hypothetical protein
MAQVTLSDALRQGRGLCDPCYESHFLVSKDDDTLLADIWGAIFLGYLYLADEYAGQDLLKLPANMLMTPPSEIRTMIKRTFPVLIDSVPASLQVGTDTQHKTLFDHLQYLYDSGWETDDIITHLSLVDL